MSGHKTRKHSLLSPSGAHRWLTCTPSARLEEEFPESTSEYAAEGTLAHELCEIKLRAYLEPTSKRSLSAKISKLKKNELWSDEMNAPTDVYVDFLKEVILSYPTMPHVAIERKLDLSEWVPDGRGIADCIVIGGDVLHIVDFKYGKGVPVSAYENEQLRLYALGAYAVYGMFYPIKTIRHTIVQPRIQDEPSTWECSIEDELTFGEYVKDRAELAIAGEGDYNPTPEACRFCRAKVKCRARADMNVKLAFEEKDSVPVTETKPALLTNDEIGLYLNYGVDVAKWVKELEEYALSECLAGKEIVGWKAVEGRKSRDWTDQEKAFQTIIDSGTPEAMLYETLPLSLAKVEKMLGKKAFEETVGDFVEKKPGKPTLVSSDDKREAITNMVKAESVFAKEENENGRRD